MKLKSLFASLLAVVMLTSCEDLFEDGTKPDGSKPYVTVNAPTGSHKFTQANGVMINLTVVDKDKVKDLNVQIADLHGETPFIDFSKQFNTNVAIIDTVVAVNSIAPGDYRMTITAKDGRSNIERKDVTFKVK